MMRRKKGRFGRSTLVLIILGLCLFPANSRGEEAAVGKEDRTPDRFGMTIDLANTYDPGHDISFALIKGFGLFDYGKVWRQDRPKELCFKVEGGLGSTFRPESRVVASLGMLALYYLDRIATPQLRPYVEAGIGVIYTDFRVEGQGLRFNFNPQLGIGAELPNKDGSGSFLALRLHHLSNGNLYHDNRGVSSIVLQAGRFF
jgi:hypothetical protein